MGRHIAYILSGGLVIAAIGCGDNSRSLPTSPELAISLGTCDLSTARGLVNSIFSTDARTPARNLLQAIQNAGAKTAASTDAGFDLFASLETNGIGTASDRSTFVNAIIPCQDVGVASSSLPIDFTGAFGANGAFGVRGTTSTDKAAVVSRDILWGLQPPLTVNPSTNTGYTWNDITTAPAGITTRRFLAYGAPVSGSTFPNGFTKETQVGTIFEWFTIPTLTFNDPGVVVGTCINDGSGSEYLIQHNAAGAGGELVPSSTTSFCPVSASLTGASSGPFALARRVLDFFRPEPLMAAALGVRPPGGSLGSLSPSAAVDPKTITLAFQGTVDDGKTQVQIKFTNNQPVSVTVTPTGLTPTDGVNVRLIATSNLGATVVASGNTATTQNGIATFPNLKISKAGGYRLIATLDGFGQNSTAGYKFGNVTSNGFNLKQTK